MRPTTLLRPRTPALVALAALFAMLGVHIVLRTNDDLSPWKGAGFAMFSTIDSPGVRSVAVWAEVAGVDQRVSLVGAWDDASRELRSLPTSARTMALARSVAASTLVRRADGNLALATTSVATLVPTASKPVVEIDRVRVDVTKLSYDGGLVRATLLQSASADAALDG